MQCPTSSGVHLVRPAKERLSVANYYCPTATEVDPMRVRNQSHQASLVRRRDVAEKVRCGSTDSRDSKSSETDRRLFGDDRSMDGMKCAP